MSTANVDEAVREANRLVSLFERRMITEGSLAAGIAELMSAETFQAVMHSLPAKIQLVMRNWAKSLPDNSPRRIIFWPLDQRVALSFKEWLREQETSENGKASG